RRSVARLVGAPPGYIGYEEGGQLTERVRRRPYCVILLDEVEKAHPEVFDILLQVLDDGRLTDGQGRTVDFRNTILILTSNLGSQFIADQALDEAARRDGVMSMVRATFKPEFLNRLDEVIIFDALTTEDLGRIVDLQIDRLARRLADRRLALSVTPAAREWLALTGFDPLYGARPLRRLVQSAIGDQPARASARRQSSTPVFAQSRAPIRSDCSTSSSATRSHCRGSRRPSASSCLISPVASSARPSRKSARASETRAST